MSGWRLPRPAYLSVLSPPELSWSASYVVLAWLAELGNGAIQVIELKFCCCCHVCCVGRR